MTAPAAQTGAGNVTTATVTASATLAADKPANVADGDLLVAVVYSRNSSGTWDTVPSGWAQAAGQNTSGTLGIFTKPIPDAGSESDTSYSWHSTAGSARGAITIFRVTGANLGNPVDATGTAATSGTSSIVAPAVTAVSAEALLLAAFTSNLSSATQPVISAPTGMNEVSGVPVSTGTATSYLEVAAQTLAAAGSTGTRTATVDPAGTSASGLMLTIAPLATGAATLAGSSALTATATRVHNAAATLAGSSALAADATAPVLASATLAGSSGLQATALQTHTGAAVLAASSSLTASAGAEQLNVLTTGGVWQPVVLHELVSGSWT